eukprot:EG_transcript_24992
MGPWAAYQACLRRAPLRTKCCTAAMMWTLTDLVTQHFEAEDKPLSEVWRPTRTLRQGFFGAAIHAPWTHVVWGALERLLPTNSVRHVALKVAVDQLISAPLFFTVYFGYTGAVQGEDLTDIQNRWRRVWPTLQVVWCVWPPVHFVNFRYVPLHNRLLVALTLQLFWNSFLSHMGNKPKAAEPPVSGWEAADLFRKLLIRRT